MPELMVMIPAEQKNEMRKGFELATAAAIERVRRAASCKTDNSELEQHNCAARVHRLDRLPSRSPLPESRDDFSLHSYRGERRDSYIRPEYQYQVNLRKAAFHVMMVVSAFIEYRCTSNKFRRQLCGAWAGFHIVSVILDLEKES